MGGILDEIIETKKREVAAGKADRSLTDLRRAADGASEPRGFARSLTATRGHVRAAVIAEIKRKSPSAGWIRRAYMPGADGSDSFAPESIARRYHGAGAGAISCLTDDRYFGGHLSFLERVREAVPLPVLRKDFLIDPWQVYESRAAGADAVLLIAECLTDDQIRGLLEPAIGLGMDVLLESHDEHNLGRGIELTADAPPGRVLLGINNRDLRTMKVDLGHTLRMARLAPDPGLLVSESGVQTPADLDQLAQSGVRIALIGESLMAQNDPGAALAAMISVEAQ